MKQQINLYQEPFRLRPAVLPARQVVWLEAGVLGLLVASSALLYFSTSRAGDTLAELTGQHRALMQANAQLKEQLERQGIDKALETAVAEADRHLQARQKVLRWIADSQSENQVRFSSLLEGPGRRPVKGLWLSQVHVADAGKALKLEGYVLDPRLVPEFLTVLQQEPAYAGREFRKLLMMAEDGEREAMRFELTTQPPDGRVSGPARPWRREYEVRR